jgi:hypothetical protein
VRDSRLALGVLAVLASMGVSRSGGAQAAAPRVAPALRADAFTGAPRAAHLGIGVGVRLGTYAWLDVAGGAGVADDGGDDGARTRTSGRVEVMGRFVLDPFEQARRGPYAAAGIAARLDDGMRRRLHLTAVIGVEGRRTSRWLPAFELGFGGGVRAGVTLRRGGRGGD